MKREFAEAARKGKKRGGEGDKGRSRAASSEAHQSLEGYFSHHRGCAVYVCARGWMRSVHQFLSVLGFTGIAPRQLNYRFSSGVLSSVLSSTSFVILIVLPLSP